MVGHSQFAVSPRGRQVDRLSCTLIRAQIVTGACSAPAAARPQHYTGRTPNAQASSGKLTNASTVLVMMMRATRPLSAP